MRLCLFSSLRKTFFGPWIGNNMSMCHVHYNTAKCSIIHLEYASKVSFTQQYVFWNVLPDRSGRVREAMACVPSRFRSSDLCLFGRVGCFVQEAFVNAAPNVGSCYRVARANLPRVAYAALVVPDRKVVRPSGKSRFSVIGTMYLFTQPSPPHPLPTHPGGAAFCKVIQTHFGGVANIL